jgi:hypothetical protein
MITLIDEVREQLQDLLTQVGLSNQVNLTAMHLNEIEAEAINFLDQLTTFRAHARHHETTAAQEALVEISVALQHMANHIQAMIPLLESELGIADTD